MPKVNSSTVLSVLVAGFILALVSLLVRVFNARRYEYYGDPTPAMGFRP